ncbi:uncharacterized protein PHALS_08466 [Plasmopara halstedii]|uniref:Uncharacterized protein n=1 Tax=Plasmopara halstedii TaxID=4781 RepID=A0A0P1ADG1_PLAHL|nr:uncharacterized protein PHALS_08466 [Plasmopara halstedii]CEG38388.1 hypothetical protein PHALS_08466 [Plasmopara halstedii]|eukprot:XP_024574757.1 hypothetical protein PHALS_08466 [Plasmopara halstedii]
MSDAMTKLVNELVNGNIKQKLYDSLKIKLFRLLKLTHLYYSNRPTLDDPIKRLISEFNKLRGEVALGNNNPELIEELKQITIDLHENKLISPSDFQAMMTHL